MGKQAVRVIVSDRIYVRAPRSNNTLHIELTRSFEHFNVKRLILEKAGLPAWSEPRTITTWERADDADPSFEILTFPRGGMARVREAIKDAGFDLALEDQRAYGERRTDVPDHLRTLYPHQEQALEAIRERENCLLRSPTGSGKTTVVFALIAREKVPALIVVPNRVLYDQWITRACEELGLRRKDVGTVRGKDVKLRSVTIGIQKSVALRLTTEKDRNYFGIVVADEVQLFAAKTFFAAIDPFPARYRIGISADHRRKDKKEFLIGDLFGDVVKEIKHEVLVASGHVLDVEIRVIPTEFRADWYGGAKEGVDGESGERANYDMQRLFDEMIADEDRNRLAIRAARELLADDDQILVLSHRREHCQMFDQVLSGMGSSTGLLLGGDDYVDEFHRTCEGLARGRIHCGVGTYQAIGLGFDIPRLGAAVCVTPIAANEQVTKQVRGRVCRTSTGKTRARMAYLWDRHVFPDHLANLARWNARTVVAHEGGWVPAKQWIKLHRAA